MENVFLLLLQHALIQEENLQKEWSQEELVGHAPSIQSPMQKIQNAHAKRKIKNILQKTLRVFTKSQTERKCAMTIKEPLAVKQQTLQET
jgi:hypothetical protein